MCVSQCNFQLLFINGRLSVILIYMSLHLEAFTTVGDVENAGPEMTDPAGLEKQQDPILPFFHSCCMVCHFPVLQFPLRLVVWLAASLVTSFLCP